MTKYVAQWRDIFGSAYVTAPAASEESALEQHAYITDNYELPDMAAGSLTIRPATQFDLDVHEA